LATKCRKEAGLRKGQISRVAVIAAASELLARVAKPGNWPRVDPNDAFWYYYG